MDSQTQTMRLLFSARKLLLATVKIALIGGVSLICDPTFAAENKEAKAATETGQDATQAVEPEEFIPAKLNSGPLPVYPADAVARRLSGRVVLRLTVSHHGSLSNVVVVTSSGHKILDEAAYQAMFYWDFDAAKRAGEPVESTLLQPVRFRIK